MKTTYLNTARVPHNCLLMLVTNFRSPTGEVVMANYATWPIQCVQNGIKAQWHDLQARTARQGFRKDTHPPKPTPYTFGKIFTMRQSRLSIIFAVALFFKCYALTVALPMAKAEDGSLEQDAFTSLLNDEATENSLGDAELSSMTKSRAPKVIVIAADANLWRDLRVLHNGLPLYKRRVDENNQVVEHKDVGQDLTIPILRRDTMRCMVGRVYRPCWEV